MNAITVDEIRAVYERPPLPDGLGDMVRTPFEEGAKAAAQPEPPAPIMQAPSAGPRPAPARKPAVKASTLNPFGDMDADMLSPEEAAFLREFMAHVTPADFAVEEE
jgi:hypothetical protein